MIFFLQREKKTKKIKNYNINESQLHQKVSRGDLNPTLLQENQHKVSFLKHMDNLAISIMLN